MNLIQILSKHNAVQVGNAVYAFVRPHDAIHAHNDINDHFPSLNVQCHEDRLWFGNDRDAKIKIGQELLQSWLDKQKHDRCWFYPEIFVQLCQLHGLPVNMVPDLTEQEFEQGCTQFRKELFHATDSGFCGVRDRTELGGGPAGSTAKSGGI